MLIRPITNGAQSSSGSITVPSRILGGLAITADGTNNAAVAVRAGSASGEKVFEITTKTPMFVFAPISIGNDDAYLEVSGTGAEVLPYEWIT